MTEYLNPHCGVEDSRHSYRCSQPGSRSYDTLSGHLQNVCARKATWHSEKLNHGEVCQNLCPKHARLFRKADQIVKPYAGLTRKLERFLVQKSLISLNTLLWLLGFISYLIYSSIRF